MLNDMLIRVLLVDDHPVVRAGIRSLLEKAPDITIIGEANTGKEALRLIEELMPDIVVLDIKLPDLSGVEVARCLQARAVPVRILALSAYDDEEYIFSLLACGAAGYLTKDEASQTIVEAVRGLAHGQEGWLSRRATAKLLRRQLCKPAAAEQPLQLSAREHEVLRLVARGYDNQAIAERLHICEGTVKNHVTNIYSKLGVRTRAEAVARAWETGLVKDEPG
ncbi:response regulator [Kallotenue papyrolyticum]|uniref:response regulator n=1 Tax=Kallotenue papyrolyticum TaxID=1325125 RepID=UPI0004B5B5B9|nr:response regulator transcription factor [Kallotenue papyrolyticum]